MISTSNLFCRWAPGGVQAECLYHSRRVEGSILRYTVVSWSEPKSPWHSKSGIGSTGIVERGARGRGSPLAAPWGKKQGDFEQILKIAKNTIDIWNYL